MDIVENMSVANAMEMDILESRIGTEQIRGADKSKVQGEHRTSDNNQDMNIAGSGGVSGGHARDGALGTNPVLTVTGEGRIHEQKHGQEHVLPVSGAEEGYHPSGHA